MKKFVISNKKTDVDRFDTEHLNRSFTYIMLNHHLNDTTFTFEDVYDEVSVMLAAVSNNFILEYLYICYSLSHNFYIEPIASFILYPIFNK